MNLRRELFATEIFEPLFLPALIAGGLLISLAGGYMTITQQMQSAPISEARDAGNGSGDRGCSDQCTCRRHYESNSSLDTHAIETVPSN